MIEDFQKAISVLRQLKTLGVKIAMDDFGTGYSSLSYLQSFPFDKIKIDKSFIADVGANKQSAMIVGRLSHWPADWTCRFSQRASRMRINSGFWLPSIATKRKAITSDHRVRSPTTPAWSTEMAAWPRTSCCGPADPSRQIGTPL
jgi:hypothetical protein